MGHHRDVRILSLLPSATEIVYALGLEDDLVGVTHECDFPADARDKRSVTFSTLAPATGPAEVDRLVSASISGGEPIYRLDYEAVRELQPDLVLSQDLCAVCAVPSGHVNDSVGSTRLWCRCRLARPELARRGPGLHPPGGCRYWHRRPGGDSCAEPSAANRLGPRERR